MQHVQIRDRLPSYINLTGASRSSPAHLLPDDAIEVAVGCSADLAARRSALVASLDTQTEARAGMVLSGTVDDVLALDARVTRYRAEIEQLDVQHAAAVEREAQDASEYKAEQKRRKALHAKAMTASGEIERLTGNEYRKLAAQMADLMRQIREREVIIAQANAALPDGAGPVPPGEPFNGRAGFGPEPIEVEDLFLVGHDVRGRQVKQRRKTVVGHTPAVPAEPHRPLSGRVILPGLGRDATPIWPQHTHEDIA